jgi:hypothetical protein
MAELWLVVVPRSFTSEAEARARADTLPAEAQARIEAPTDHGPKTSPEQRAIVGLQRCANAVLRWHEACSREDVPRKGYATSYQDVLAGR